MKLIMLRCPSCSQELTPGEEDLIVLCAQCGAAIEFAEDGLHPIDIRYAASGSKKTEWRPWWVFNGQVSLVRRETQSGNQRDEALRFWEKVTRLYVPAWELSLQAVREAGLAQLKAQPPLQAMPRPAGARCAPVVVSASDARQLLDYLVLTVEAGRKDWLKDLQFTVEVGLPELWALA
jgi:hypothetical protein